MPTTTNNGIYYIDDSSIVSRVSESATQAQSIEDALTNNYGIHTFRWAGQAEMDGELDARAGDVGFREDTGETFTFDGAEWFLSGFKPRMVVAAPAALGLTTTPQDVHWSTEIISDPSMLSSTDWSKIFIPESGIYEVQYSMYAATATLVARASIYVNGVQHPYGRNYQMGHSEAGPRLNGIATIPLDAADYVQIRAEVTSGSVGLATTQSQLRVRRIG